MEKRRGKRKKERKRRKTAGNKEEKGENKEKRKKNEEKKENTIAENRGNIRKFHKNCVFYINIFQKISQQEI